MVTFVTTYHIAPGVIYCIHPHHRNGTRRKSQWDISEDQERDVFANAHSKNWIIMGVGWGLHIVAGKADYLGTAEDRRCQLFFAKFVNRNRDQFWHGYAADHQRRSSDIPSSCILHQWLTADLLRRAVMCKIVRRQPCTL